MFSRNDVAVTYQHFKCAFLLYSFLASVLQFINLKMFFKIIDGEKIKNIFASSIGNHMTGIFCKQARKLQCSVASKYQL